MTPTPTTGPTTPTASNTPTTSTTPTTAPTSTTPGPATDQRTLQPPAPPRAWRVIAVLVLVGAVITGASMAWSQFAQRAERHRQTYSDPIHTVEIDGSAGDVTVSASTDGRAEVSDLVGWVIGRPTVSQEVAGDTLKVAVGCPGEHLVLGCAATVDIAVPAATTVKLTTSTGRAVIRGMSGEVHASTEDGRLELRELTGPLWVKSESGQVDGSGLASPEAELLSDSGQAILSFTRPPAAVTARLASAPLILGLPDDGSRYRIDYVTVDGRLDNTRGIEDASSPRVLDLSTASAPVTITRTKPAPHPTPTSVPSPLLTSPPLTSPPLAPPP